MNRMVLLAAFSAVLAVVLAACAGETAAPQVIEKEVIVTQEVVREVPVEKVVTQEIVKTIEVPVEKVVTQEVIKEVMVPGETVVVTKEVVKEVPVEVVVTKEVIKEVKIPGETVIVEVPKEVIKEVVKVVEIEKALLPEFGEAPKLAQLVAAGKLPPVEDRVSEEPLVITGQEIGRYGGSLRRAFTSSRDQWNYGRMAKTGLLRWTLDGQILVPGVARSWEHNSDFSVWTFKLRRGMKWSDGMPFTADDFVFQHNDVILNDELVITKVHNMVSGGILTKFEKVDDFTVRYTWPAPYSLFGKSLTELDSLRGDARTLYHPTHYMKQFLPKYGGQAAVDKMAKDGGFETWVQMYQNKSDTVLNPDKPSTRPWLITADITQPRMIADRNPFFYGIDRAGNQLPYIDRLVFELVPDRELIILKSLAGEIDMQGRHIAFSSFPVLKQGEEKGGYKVFKYSPLGLIHAGLRFNLLGVGPEGEFLANKDFRIALSHAINRQEVNDILFYGLGQPRNHVAPRANPWYPGDKYGTLYLDYDPDKSNAMLDAIGLDKKDSDGFRLMPNGDRLNIQISTYNYGDNQELIANYWNAVGVHTDADVSTRALWETRVISAENFMVDGEGLGTTSQFNTPPSLEAPCCSFVPKEYSRWHASGGKEGKEPPDAIKQWMTLTKEGAEGTPEDRDTKAIEMGRLFAENQWTVTVIADVPSIFVVSNNLANVAEVAATGFGIRTPANLFPEVFFFRK